MHARPHGQARMMTSAERFRLLAHLWHGIDDVTGLWYAYLDGMPHIVGYGATKSDAIRRLWQRLNR